MDEDKRRCFIINCLTALHLVQLQRAKHVVAIIDRKVESVKRKVFSRAVPTMINDDYKGDKTVMDTILSVFPNESRMYEETSWLSMHFATAFTANNQINEDGVLVLNSKDPLGMHRLSKKEIDEEDEEDEEENEELRKETFTGCTPVPILCMQKQPKISLVRHLCLHDPKAFSLCDQSGRCTLHLVAQYSKSMELLFADRL